MFYIYLTQTFGIHDGTIPVDSSSSGSELVQWTLEIVSCGYLVPTENFQLAVVLPLPAGSSWGNQRLNLCLFD